MRQDPKHAFILGTAVHMVANNSKGSQRCWICSPGVLGPDNGFGTFKDLQNIHQKF
jgi:hypothetical protein